ncbi:MAG: hypothetical protein QHH14_10815 [Clostridiales bacterium]|nr:hypothetical protein [Clostridiales bacterium]
MSCLGVWLGFGLADEELNEQQKQEIFLRQARVVEVDRNEVGGRTAPWIITLDDGEKRQRAIFKHVDSRRPQPTPDSYKYELAAYELAKLLGIGIVPPVVEREVSGRKGSLQVFLENFLKEKDRQRKKIEPPDPKSFADALEEVKVLENLVYDVCLDADDIWIHKDNWTVCRVDFSEAFDTSAELLQGCEISRCSRKLYQGLLQLKDGAAAARLAPYLNKNEIKALLQRKNLIIEKIRKLIEEKGEEAVLFA